MMKQRTGIRFRLFFTFAFQLLIGIFFISCTTTPAFADAKTDSINQQMGTMGIHLGMTISEVEQLVRSQGGDIRRGKPFNKEQDLRFIQDGGRYQLFEYVVTPIPMPPPPTRQQMQEARKRHQLLETKLPDYSINLYVYPRQKGRLDDPSNLVVYAMITAKSSGPMPMPGSELNLTINDFVEQMHKLFGPVREIITGSFKPVFSFLPDLKEGKSYSAKDISLVPGDDLKREGDATTCSYMMHEALQIHKINFTLSRDPAVASNIIQNGLPEYLKLHFRISNKLPEEAFRAYKAWGKCGDVVTIQLQMRGQMIRQISLYHYSLDELERAVKAFAAGP